MPLGSGALVAIIGFAAGVRNPWTILTLLFGGYAAWVTIVQLSRGGTKALKRGRRRIGAYIIHAGAVIVFVAIAVSSTMKIQTEAQLQRGQTAQIGAYAVTFIGTEVRTEPNRESTIARFAVTKDGKAVTTMEPRMNQYAAMREPIGTPDVHSTLTRDLYLSITNIDPSSQSVSVLMLINPMVSWIWLAVIMMGVGGLITLIPKRSVVLSEAKDPLREATPGIA
jgi:cytochrome c-type biogenesis protein CcmF